METSLDAQANLHGISQSMIDEQKQKLKRVDSTLRPIIIDQSLTKEPYCSNTARGIDR
jgi:hypothetical protein